MKKVKFTLALSMLLATACTQNEDLAVIAPEGNEGSNGNISLTASFDGGTRTNSPDGIITKWVEGDDIYVGASGAMNKFSLHDGAGTTTGIFTASGVTIEGDLYAVYGPFANGAPSISETSITSISIPDTWEYSSTKNSENCIMAGKVNTINKTVAFKNAGAILYITIGGGITFTDGTTNSLKVTTTTTPITGAATITASETEPAYTCAGNKAITITELNSGTEQKIVIPMPVISTAEVITVKLVSNDGNGNSTEKLIFSESAKLERNKYYSIKYTTEGEQAVFSEAGLTAALTAGNKVVLGKDITLSSASDYTLSANATIDLNGHKLSSTKKIDTTNGTNNYTLSIIGTTEGSSLEVSEITASAALTLTDVTLSGNIAISAGDLTITGGTITGHITNSGTGNINYTGGTLNGDITSTGGTDNKITNVTINNASGDYGIKATSDSYNSATASKFTISGGSITANKTAVYVQYTNLDISGCGLKVNNAQQTTPNGDGFCIAIMGGLDVSSAPAKGEIILGKAASSTGAGDGKPNTYTVASGNTNNVYVFANESSRTDLTITNNDNAKIQWKTPASNP